MADHPVSLSERRADMEADNKLWTPEECLRAVLRDLKSGEIEADSILVLAVRMKDDDTITRNWYAANVSTLEHLALLDIMKQEAREKLLHG